MRINRIILENFRNYENLDLTMEWFGKGKKDTWKSRLLVVGENGLGKSTIRDAISWALRGQCRGVDGKGQGQRDLIRNGSESAGVTVVTDDLTVNRTIGKSGGAITSMKPEQVLGALGTTDGMLKAVLYGDAFFDMHHAEAKELLMGALDVRIPVTHLPPSQIQKGTDSISLEELDALYDIAFRDRTNVKRDLAAAQVPTPPKAVAIKNSDSLQTKLVAEQDTLRDLVRATADADNALKTGQANLDAAELSQGEIGKLEGALGAHETMLVDHRAQLATAKTNLDAAERERAEPVDTLQASVREQEVLIERIGRHDPDRGCVLAASIPCLTKAQEFAGQVESIRQAVEALRVRVQAGQARDQAIVSAGQSVKDAERHVAYHQKQIEDSTEKLTKARAAAANLQALKSAITGLKKKAKAAADAATKQRGVVDGLVSQVRTVAEFETAEAAYQAAKTKKTELEQKVEAAEDLVAKLGPTGIRVPILQERLGGFHAEINRALEAFGFSLEIRVNPWDVIVTTALGPVRWEMLSKGQRLWTGLAFQLALADVSGLDFCVIDDAEAVVGEHRQMMTGTVMTASTGQIMVMMAKSDAEANSVKEAAEADPDLAGLQVFKVA